MDRTLRTVRNVSLVIGFGLIVGGFLSLPISADIYYDAFAFGICFCGFGIAVGFVARQQKPQAGNQSTERTSPARQSQQQIHTESFVKPIVTPLPKTVLNQPEPELIPIHETIDNTIFITTEEELDAFSSDHSLVEEFFTKAVGVTHLNDDGSNRQKILSRCAPGDPVIFHSYKYEGAPAIAVFTQYGQIGHLSASLADRLENGYGFDVILSGTISEITGGSKGVYWGCNLLIKVFADDAIEHTDLASETQPQGPEPKQQPISSAQPVTEESEIETIEQPVSPGTSDNFPFPDADTTDATAIVASTDHDKAEPDPAPEIQSIPTEQPVSEESKNETVNPPSDPAVPDNVRIPDTDTEDTTEEDTTEEDNSSVNQETDMLDYIRDPQIMSHYIVLDIETTGFSRDNDKIIEIAAIHYVFGEEAKRFHTYVNPQMPIPRHITKLTGIRQADVDTAPLLEDIADDFLEFIKGYPLVGHNIIKFDLPFLASNMDMNEDTLVIDTLEMSRIAFPLLPSHKLPDLNFWFSLNKGPSHRAGADVAATNALLWACLYPDKYSSLYRKAVRDGLPEPEHANKPKPRHYYERITLSEITPDQNQEIISGPLLGKKIVFTGELSISRKEAMQMAVDAGALLRSGVSGRTDILVVGKQDLSVVGPNSMSYKQEKAQELNNSGKAQIQILSESEFLSLFQKDKTTV